MNTLLKRLLVLVDRQEAGYRSHDGHFQEHRENLHGCFIRYSLQMRRQLRQYGVLVTPPVTSGQLVPLGQYEIDINANRITRRYRHVVRAHFALGSVQYRQRGLRLSLQVLNDIHYGVPLFFLIPVPLPCQNARGAVPQKHYVTYAVLLAVFQYLLHDAQVQYRDLQSQRPYFAQQIDHFSLLSALAIRISLVTHGHVDAAFALAARVLARFRDGRHQFVQRYTDAGTVLLRFLARHSGALQHSSERHQHLVVTAARSYDVLTRASSPVFQLAGYLIYHTAVLLYVVR